MSKANINDLLGFLQPFPENVKEMALWIRELIWDLYPNSNELIYDNYNALALGWSTSDKVGDTFCSIAVYSKYLHFGFYWGSKIDDPEKILLGKGNQYRYIIIRNKSDFPKTYIKKLLKEAYSYSEANRKKAKILLKGQTITKSISPVKRRPK